MFRRIRVPTGDILIVDVDHGKLECLSLGDYGKDVNIKCDAMGLFRDPGTVTHQQMLPLSKKWVVTISTQYGCSMGCRFCDVPKVGPGKNATIDDLVMQFDSAMSLHPEITSGERLNLHFARMGEPTFNPNVIEATTIIAEMLRGRFGFHPVVSTMMPWNKSLGGFIHDWLLLKNAYAGEAGLQLSINSTNETERRDMFSRNSLTLKEISEVMSYCWRPLRGRKVTLNFAVCGYEIDAAKLRRHFDPHDYIVKLTPMHKTSSATCHGLVTDGDATTMHPYARHEEELKAAGFDVLVFIASKEEDESRITCGNAILSDEREEQLRNYAL